MNNETDTEEDDLITLAELKVKHDEVTTQARIKAYKTLRAQGYDRDEATRAAQQIVLVARSRTFIEDWNRNPNNDGDA